MKRLQFSLMPPTLKFRNKDIFLNSLANNSYKWGNYLTRYISSLIYRWKDTIGNQISERPLGNFYFYKFNIRCFHFLNIFYIVSVLFFNYMIDKFKNQHVGHLRSLHASVPDQWVIDSSPSNIQSNNFNMIEPW